MAATENCLMPDFMQALDPSVPQVAAWDYDDNDRERLVLYSVGAGGARQRAVSGVAHESQEAVVDTLLARGVRIGGCYGATPFVWVADSQGFAVWNDTALTADGPSPSEDVRAVRVFLDPEDRGHRGVRLERTSSPLIVAEERSVAPRLDVTYGEDNLYYDTLWAHYLGLHLAVWHDVPLDNEISPSSIADDLEVARALRDMAKVLDATPPTGMFGEIARTVGRVGRSPELTLVLRPELGEPAARLLDIGVRSASGKSISSRTIRRTTHASMVAFLRRVTTTATVQFAMNAVLGEQLEREGG